MSSLPPMAPLPPFAFTLIEDVVAVDGGGGTSFRRAWAERYQASYLMRKLIRDVSFGWGITGTVFGGVWTGIVIPDFVADDVAVGIGYGLPWGWALVMTAWTVWYSKRMIAREYRCVSLPLRFYHRNSHLHSTFLLHVLQNSHTLHKIVNGLPPPSPPPTRPTNAPQPTATCPSTSSNASSVPDPPPVLQWASQCTHTTKNVPHYP